MYQRKCLESHPWISFKFDVRLLSSRALLLLGEALSKCDHVSGAPLPPGLAREMNKVFLSKGIHATTSIEGNTLSEDEVRKRIDHDLKLPDSLEYQGEEVDNLLALLNEIADSCADGTLKALSVERIKDFNRELLQGQPLEEGVVPGEFRFGSVVVGNVYRGAPAEDCDYLMDRFVSFVNDDLRTDDSVWSEPLKIVRAILAHLYLAWIHPFGDGNGRTARLIEFQLLLEAGIPVPAAHLLSDYYNRSRSRYYLTMKNTSTARDLDQALSDFIDYALQGFVEGLREQVTMIETNQLGIAWESYVHEVFSHQPHSEAQKRRRLLVFALPFPHGQESIVPASRVRKLTPELAEMYANKQAKTVTRDLNALVDLGLIRKIDGGYQSNIMLMAAFLPAIHDAD